MDELLDPAILRMIPNHPPVQASLTDQLMALLVLANKFGLHGAAAHLRQNLFPAPGTTTTG